jgi:hypothetical protein
LVQINGIHGLSLIKSNPEKSIVKIKKLRSDLSN